MDELPLEAPPEILAKLISLLPDDGSPVTVREEGSPRCCYVRSIVVELLRDALAKGYAIELSNEGDPIEEWDGWLVVRFPKRATLILTNWVKP